MWCMDESFFRWCGRRGSDWAVRYRVLCCTSLNLCSNAQNANEDYVTLTFSVEGEERSEWDSKKQKDDEEKCEGMEQSAIKTEVKDSKREGEVKLKTAAPLCKTKNAVIANCTNCGIELAEKTCLGSSETTRPLSQHLHWQHKQGTIFTCGLFLSSHLATAHLSILNPLL